MTPEPWPPDRAATVERLMAVLHDIDASTDVDRRALLSDLLRVAWPTWWAQDQ